MWLRDPGQGDPYLQEDVTNGPKVNVKWWVPSRAYTRVKFTFSPFGAAKTVAVGNSLGGSFKIAVVPPAGSNGFAVPSTGWYRLKVSMTLYRGKRAAGSQTLRMYVDLQKPTLQGTDLVTTIDRGLDPNDWDPLQVQFDDNLPQSAESSVAAGYPLAGIFYLKATPIIGGGPAGDGLSGTLCSRWNDLTGVLTNRFATGRPTDLYIEPAKDASGAYLPGTYAQKLVFGDAAGNRSTETVVFTVLPAPSDRID